MAVDLRLSSACRLLWEAPLDSLVDAQWPSGKRIRRYRLSRAATVDSTALQIIVARSPQPPSK
jgi:hypothetical protein